MAKKSLVARTLFLQRSSRCGAGRKDSPGGDAMQPGYVFVCQLPLLPSLATLEEEDERGGGGGGGGARGDVIVPSRLRV